MTCHIIWKRVRKYQYLVEQNIHTVHNHHYRIFHNNTLICFVYVFHYKTYSSNSLFGSVTTLIPFFSLLAKWNVLGTKLLLIVKSHFQLWYRKYYMTCFLSHRIGLYILFLLLISVCFQHILKQWDSPLFHNMSYANKKTRRLFRNIVSWLWRIG